MQPLKNNNHSLRTGLSDRLEMCVDKVGGKRALATAALISEAQLFRYLNGESDVPSDRLLAIAKAAQVDAGWLLTGQDSGGTKELRPAFRSELMVQIAQLFEELMVEFEKPFKPRQRARAITFLYNAYRHEEAKRGVEYQLNKFDLLKSINYLAELRTEEELDILNHVITLLEYSRDVGEYTSEQRELLRTWNNLLVRGTRGYYSSYPGQVYFERTSGGNLDAASVLDLQNLAVKAYSSTGKTQLDWLDLGCGSGRHLLHLAKHMPNLNLKGIELSQLGFRMCQDLMDAEKLPKDCVVMGDARHLPYPANQFDVVFANLSLYCLPYLPGSGLGLEEAMAEITRVMRSNGLVKMVFPMGDWRDYSMSYQFMDKDMMTALVKDTPFEILDFMVEVDDMAPKTNTGGAPTNPMRLNHATYLHVLMKKRG